MKHPIRRKFKPIRIVKLADDARIRIVATTTTLHLYREYKLRGRWHIDMDAGLSVARDRGLELSYNIMQAVCAEVKT